MRASEPTRLADVHAARGEAMQRRQAEALAGKPVAKQVADSTVSKKLADTADKYTETEVIVKTAKAIPAVKSGFALSHMAHLGAASSVIKAGRVVGHTFDALGRAMPIINLATAGIDRATTSLITHDPLASRAARGWAWVTEGLSWTVVGLNGYAIATRNHLPKKGPLLWATLGADLVGIGTGLARDATYLRDTHRAPEKR